MSSRRRVKVIKASRPLTKKDNPARSNRKLTAPNILTSLTLTEAILTKKMTIVSYIDIYTICYMKKSRKISSQLKSLGGILTANISKMRVRGTV